MLKQKCLFLTLIPEYMFTPCDAVTNQSLYLNPGKPCFNLNFFLQKMS